MTTVAHCSGGPVIKLFKSAGYASLYCVCFSRSGATLTSALETSFSAPDIVMIMDTKENTNLSYIALFSLSLKTSKAFPTCLKRSEASGSSF